jgi:hypothetical protein
MVSQLFALCLVALATSPYTAPFSVCDLSEILGDRHATSGHSEVRAATPCPGAPVLTPPAATQIPDLLPRTHTDEAFHTDAGLVSAAVVKIRRGRDQSPDAVPVNAQRSLANLRV